jgi:molybdenum cofactor guanylyltransferase
MMAHNISGVILSGGANKRFNGVIKAKIVINGKTIISRVIEIVSNFFDEIIIVTNTPDDFREFKNCKIIRDQFLNKGPLGGIHSALKESERDALFVFAGDMPLLDSEIIAKQIDVYNTNKCDILIPQIEQFIEPLHGIYTISIIRILENFLERDNDYAMREFFKKANVRYMKIEGSEKTRRAFTNINSPSDISTVKELLESTD